MQKRLYILLCILLILGGIIRTYLNPPISERSTQLDKILPVETVTGKELSFQIVALVTGLQVPRAVVQTSSERLLITERPGRVRQIVAGMLIPESLLTLPDISSSEEGLMTIVLDPSYVTNKRLYLSYAYKTKGTTMVKLVRYTDAGDSLKDPLVIRDMLPAAKRHAGSAVAFGPEGDLYITVGDATDKQYAQSLDQYHGKILRIHPDGSIPIDNPFSGSAIWSYGHRNSQGIAWMRDGKMYASEHGPSTFDGPPGGDEINHILPGMNYGRPVVSHEKHENDMQDPIAIYTPAIAPASLLIYHGNMFPERNDHLFMGMLKGEGILKLIIDPSNPGKILSTQKIVDNRYGRIRFVGQAPDGSIYFTTSNEDGRGKHRSEGDVVYQIIRK